MLPSAGDRILRHTLPWAVLLASIVCPAGTSAQTVSGTLEGTVRTFAGRAVPEAVVQARSDDNGGMRNAVADIDGRYRLALTPGVWTVVARLSDGRLSQSRSVTVRLQETVKLDFTVGSGPSEHVTVRAEAPLVDRRRTSGQLRVSGRQADTLPLDGRVFTDLAVLDSSVRRAAPGNFFGERGSVLVINGQSGRSNSFLVDGLDNNDQTSGTTVNSFFSQLVIEDFVLLTHQYAPEFGRATGGVLNIVTRRGSNEPTLQAFVQGTAANLSETGDFVESLPDTGGSGDTVRRFQIGVSAGGPMRRDKAFYFVAFERQDSDDVIPYTGVDRDGIRGGRLAAPSYDNNLFFRTDFNLGPTTTLMFRLSADDRAAEGLNVGGIFTPEAGFRLEERDVQLAATLSKVISPRLLIETRFLAGTSDFNQFANSDRPGVSRPSGVFGGNNLNRQLRTEDRVQLVHNLTWKKGEHELKFGLDLTHSDTQISARFNPNGNFIYDYDFPFTLGDCLDITASEALNHNPDGTISCGEGEPANIFSYPLVYTLIMGEPSARLRDTKVALFAQDKWEVGRRLLLEYGLRWDYSTYRLPGDARVDSVVPNGGADRDRDDFAPRLGFTFTPKADGKLVLRGGAGVFYDKLVLAFPGVAAITSGTEIGLFFPQGFAVEQVNETEIEEKGLDFILPSLFFADQLTLRFSTGTRLDTPYTVQYNLGMERAVGRSGSLRANVVRAEGRHLPLMKDLNPVSGRIPVGVPCTESTIDPDLEVGIPCHLNDPAKGSIAAVVTEGRSWYTGLDLGWRWQGEEGWFSASYTLSKAEDMGFDPLKGGIALPPDSDNLAAERGRSDGDRRHRLVLSGETPLPWMGLRSSSVMQLSSGLPFNVTTGQDDNLDGILSDRPAGVGRNAGEDASTVAIDDARDQPVVELGTYRPLREHSFFQIDLRVFRPFLFKQGRGKGQFFLQVINLLDRQNVGLIEGRAISPDLGEITGLAGPPRTLELGLKLGY